MTQDDVNYGEREGMTSNNENKICIFTQQKWQSVWRARELGMDYQQIILQIENVLQEPDCKSQEQLTPNTHSNLSEDYRLAIANHKMMKEILNRTQRVDDGIREIWRDWHDSQMQFRHQIAAEGFKAIILVSGTATIAALSILSGQITDASATAKMAAKVGLVGSISSLLLTALGQALSIATIDKIFPTVRTAVLPTEKPVRLYALVRYCRLYSKWLKRGASFIYASIVIFAITSIICTFILLFA
jgi:hypothetical protein